jgi:hypothetical protein
MTVLVECIYKTQRTYLKLKKKLSHIIVFYSMCPGKFYNNINIFCLNIFVLNKSNVIDFVTFFYSITLPITL